ncbi:MAG: GAF domain-containing protein, partial [Pseudomonadota bacterium]|nr:GAF domain-containing protein [Pseudomonadota bacterium]
MSISPVKLKGKEKGADLASRLFERRPDPAGIKQIRKDMNKADRKELADIAGRMLEKMTAMTEISSRLSEKLSLNELFPRLVDLVVETVRAERCTVFLFDDDTDELFSRVLVGQQIGEIRMPAEAGIAGAVFRTNQAEIISNAYKDDRFNPDIDERTGFKTRNMLCAPLVSHDGAPIGVVQVLNKKGGSFTSYDMALLESLIDQAVPPLRNAHLFEQVERARAEEIKLQEVTRAISTELQVEELLGKICRIASQFTGAERSSLFLYDSERNRLVTLIAEGLEKQELVVPTDVGLVGCTFTEGKLLNVADAGKDLRFNTEIDRKTGFVTRNILCVPIFGMKGRKLGVMQLLNKTRGVFTRHDENWMRAFVGQISIALENARLFEAVDNARNHNENILKSLSNGVITLDSKNRVTKINDAARNIMGWKRLQPEGLPVGNLFRGPNVWLADAVSKVAQSGKTEILVERDIALRSSGSITTNVTVVPLIDAKEARIGTMMVLEDTSREKRIKSAMARYMAPEIVDQMIAEGQADLGGVMRQVSVLFCDIRNFTAISARTLALG